jgi:hypothetical protein
MEAIINAATEFENRLQANLREYTDSLASDMRLIPTERRVIQEIF